LEDYVKSAVIFGGTGFIGSFFCKYLLDSHLVDKVFLVDIESLEEKKIKYRSKLLQDKNVSFIKGDVKEPLHLKENEYEYQFNLEQALLDWKREKKSDW